MQAELFEVTFLSDAGDIVTRTVEAWHAAAAERTIFTLYGGSSHTAKPINTHDMEGIAHA